MKILCKKFAKLQKEYSNYDRNAIIPKVESEIRKNFERCKDYDVTPISGKPGEFIISRTDEVYGYYAETHELDKMNRTCTCGLWQDNDYPCIDYLAYLSIHEEIKLPEILESNDHVSQLYRYWSLQKLYQDNLSPVIMSILEKDKVTLPPNTKERKPRGKARKKRIRLNRSKYADPVKDSVVVCKFCHVRSHNVRTCGQRKKIEAARQAYIEAARDEHGIVPNGTYAEAAVVADPAYPSSIY
jgi:hypothetical protein